MNDSPASVLFDVDGYQVARQEGDFVTPGLPIGGVDALLNFKLARILNNAIAVSQQPSREIVGRYLCGTPLVTGAALVQNVVTIENPVGSGRSIYIDSVDINGLSATNFTTPFLYRIARSTGVPTGGTIVSSQGVKSSYPAAVAIVRTLPTVTAAAGNLWVGSPGVNNTGAQANRPKETTSFVVSEDDKEILLASGEALIMIADVNSTNWRHYANIRWSEV